MRSHDEINHERIVASRLLLKSPCHQRLPSLPVPVPPLPFGGSRAPAIMVWYNGHEELRPHHGGSSSNGWRALRPSPANSRCNSAAIVGRRLVGRRDRVRIPGPANRRYPRMPALRRSIRYGAGTPSSVLRLRFLIDNARRRAWRSCWYRRGMTRRAFELTACRLPAMRRFYYAPAKSTGSWFRPIRIPAQSWQHRRPNALRSSSFENPICSPLRITSICSCRSCPCWNRS